MMAMKTCNNLGKCFIEKVEWKKWKLKLFVFWDGMKKPQVHRGRRTWKEMYQNAICGCVISSGVGPRFCSFVVSSLAIFGDVATVLSCLVVVRNCYKMGNGSQRRCDLLTQPASGRASAQHQAWAAFLLSHAACSCQLPVRTEASQVWEVEWLAQGPGLAEVPTQLDSVLGSGRRRALGLATAPCQHWLSGVGGGPCHLEQNERNGAIPLLI